MKTAFHDKIDSSYLQILYGDDLIYIKEVFESAIREVSSELNLLNEHFEKKDIVNLKKSVHKIKPLFGFVGLMATQNECQQFENKCASIHDVSVIEMDYKTLLQNIEESRSILEMEINKLARA